SRSLFAALALVLVPVAAIGPAAAQASGYYVATPVAAPTKPQLMTRSTPWRVAGASYVAPRAPDRNLVVCQLVAREAGRLQGFA
ncbi:CC_3452 family protein, partial [Salmonella enterica subsp. enterica serovar Enteritidis]|uniref:CC_3452 family protein n=1 Tax=Salmonella enterica TaxID=28901 RepID=UPI0039EAEF47